MSISVEIRQDTRRVNVTGGVTLLSQQALLERLGFFAVPLADDDFLRIVGLELVGASPSAGYYVSDLFRDDVSGGRFQFLLKRASDDVTVAGVGASGSAIDPAGFTGQKTIPLVTLNSSGITGSVTVDFGDGSPRFAATGTASNALLANHRAILTTAAFTDAVEEIAAEAAAAGLLQSSDLFAGGAGDSYAKRLMRGGVIGGGDPDDTYWINYETIYFSGIPLYRVQFFLCSARYGGDVIARWGAQAATEGALYKPASVYLTNSADGSRPFGDDPGVTLHMDVDWAAVEWTHAETEYADGAATGIHPANVKTADEVQAAWLHPSGPAWARRVTVGATTGDYATIVAAINAITIPDALLTVTRTSYPASNLCSPERPLLIEVVEAHTEEVTPFTHLGVGQSPLNLPHGCILRTRPDTNIWMNSAGTEPLMEANFTCLVDGGGLFDQRGPGYTVHSDNFNGISEPGGGDPNVQRRRIQTVFRGVHLRHRVDNATPNIGGGTGDGQYILIDQVYCSRDANTTGTDYLFWHTSPNETIPATIHLRRVLSNAADVAGVALLSLSKIYTATVRHNVIVEDSDCKRVEVANSVGGAPGFIRRGLLSGATVVGTIDIV